MCCRNRRGWRCCARTSAPWRGSRPAWSTAICIASCSIPRTRRRSCMRALWNRWCASMPRIPTSSTSTRWSSADGQSYFVVDTAAESEKLKSHNKLVPSEYMEPFKQLDVEPDPDWLQQIAAGQDLRLSRLPARQVRHVPVGARADLRQPGPLQRLRRRRLRPAVLPRAGSELPRDLDRHAYRRGAARAADRLRRRALPLRSERPHGAAVSRFDPRRADQAAEPSRRADCSQRSARGAEPRRTRRSWSTSTTSRASTTTTVTSPATSCWWASQKRFAKACARATSARASAATSS